MTSVWICDGSTSLCSPWFSQKRDVSVSSGSIVTRNLSFDSAAVHLAPVGEGQQRIEALAEVAVHLALECMSSKARSTS